MSSYLMNWNNETAQRKCPKRENMLKHEVKYIIKILQFRKENYIELDPWNKTTRTK